MWRTTKLTLSNAVNAAMKAAQPINPRRDERLVRARSASEEIPVRNHRNRTAFQAARANSATLFLRSAARRPPTTRGR